MVCVYIHMRTYTYVCIYIYVYLHVYIHIFWIWMGHMPCREWGRWHLHICIDVYIRVSTYISIYIYTYMGWVTWLYTLILPVAVEMWAQVQHRYMYEFQVISHKRATNYRALLRKMAYKDKASYESPPFYTLTLPVAAISRKRAL